MDAELMQEEEEEAKKEAEKARPGLTVFTDGSRLEDGAAGYAVAWKRGESWVGIKAHMGYNQEAYDAECVALARALESATRRSTIPERVTIFTDAQAAIKRIASEEPSPGQKYSLQARKHVATLRRSRPGIIIEIRWCPAHKGVPGNEKADEWAKLAAEEPDARGVEWLAYSDRAEARSMPLPRSLANIKPRSPRRSGQRHDSGREAGPPRRSTRCREARGRTARLLVVPVPHANERTPAQGVPRVANATEDSMGGGAEGDWEMEEPVEDPGSFRRPEVQSGSIGFVFIYGRGEDSAGCGRSGRRGGRDVGMELRERQEREEERRAEELDAENEAAAGEEPPLFLPIPSFMTTAGEE